MDAKLETKFTLVRHDKIIARGGFGEVYEGHLVDKVTLVAGPVMAFKRVQVTDQQRKERPNIERMAQVRLRLCARTTS